MMTVTAFLSPFFYPFSVVMASAVNKDNCLDNNDNDENYA